MAGLDREKLKRLLSEAGRTPRDVSRAVGDNPYLLRDILSGKSRNPRSDTLVKIADELHVGLGDIMSERAAGVSEEATPFQGPRRPRNLRLAIRFEVGAGGFLPRDDLPQEPYGYQTVQSIPPYADLPQWLERVVSDSMDRVIPVGSLLHVVDAVAIEYEARHGDIVVVKRTMNQGAYVERTVKRVKLTPGGPELWPESHNPRWAGPIPLIEGVEGAEDLTVEIAGLVLRSYQFFVSAPEEPEAA